MLLRSDTKYLLLNIARTLVPFGTNLTIMVKLVPKDTLLEDNFESYP